LFFVFLTATGLFLEAISLGSIMRNTPRRALDHLPQRFTGFEPQISVLVPAYNESATIADSIRSLLQLSYTRYEIIVINDGSSDSTLEVLKRDFALRPFPEVYQTSLPTAPIRSIYVSQSHAKLRVIDKENGGKADALNAGINLSRNPLFCTLDSDSILQRDSLQRLAQPFLDDPSTVATGGTVRIANGCVVKEGFLAAIGLPTNWLALFQVLEYYRAFWVARGGLAPMNALLIISGAFGLFRKTTVVEVGGYARHLLGEDMELVVRLHRHLRLLGHPYRISFVPHAFCWTEAPENLRSLRNQRIRWQRGLAESLVLNRSLLFHHKGGVVGWLALPIFILFEWLSPAVLVFGYIFAAFCYFTGLWSAQATLAFLLLEIGLGVLTSMSAVFVDELSFHIYPKFRQVFVLFVVAIAENFGFRQLVTYWRLIGLWRWMIGAKGGWGTITRTAAWQASRSG
jgi:cellulose synthase/poly-beta-1,6-N-acetylglucosamine synthase-like glycosyltransferase